MARRVIQRAGAPGVGFLARIPKPVRALLCAVACGVIGGPGLALPGAAPPSDTLPSDIVADFKPPVDERDYLQREVMIPMRDGVRLRAVIAMKKGVTRGPLLLERTPYGADSMAFHSGADHLAARVSPMNRPFAEDGYILVWEDIRGRSQSEGTFVLNRPLDGPLNPTGIDEATDAFDTIDWLVKNVPECNQRVGIIGGSYDGALALSAALNGHPSLAAIVAINPMVDVWNGDDWFHNGAFRQITLGVLPILLTGKERGAPRPSGSVDLYATYLESGSAGDAMRRYGLDQFPPARKFIEHPSFDAYWRAQALDRVLASRQVSPVPTLLVAGMWDEQDQYGAPAMFEALRAQDSNRRVSLLVGPWNHMGVGGDGSRLGSLRFIEDTAAAARRDVIKPFLDARLKQGADAQNLAPVVSFTTGTERWHASPSLSTASQALYLHARGGLSFEAPAAGEVPGWDEYISDPAHPVGVLAGPFNFAHTWATSLVADQRFAAQRPDVLTYRSAPLEAPVHVLGLPEADLVASTSGTDSDWVVKLIDVYPDDASDAEMAGFQLAVSANIFRGRYIHGRDQVYCWKPGRAEEVRYPLPLVDHAFLPGHRIMVQVQSSWFPTYDRNPQTCVPNIFNARPSDYLAAKQTLFHDRVRASKILLPIAPN